MKRRNYDRVVKQIHQLIIYFNEFADDEYNLKNECILNPDYEEENENNDNENEPDEEDNYEYEEDISLEDNKVLSKFYNYENALSYNPDYFNKLGKWGEKTPLENIKYKIKSQKDNFVLFADSLEDKKVIEIFDKRRTIARLRTGKLPIKRSNDTQSYYPDLIFQTVTGGIGIIE